jgi:hypothetical protein
MPLFTFYPCLADGSSTAFETIECADEALALLRARRVLAEHPSSVEVVVWHNERRVGVVTRQSMPA